LTAHRDTSTNAGPARPLQGETIIYFGPEGWDGMWRNRHQLMSRFARRNRVIYVEPALMLRPALRRLLGRSEAPNRAHSRSFTAHKSGVIIYHSPWWTPLSGRQPFRNLGLWLYFKVLLRRCLVEGSCRPIIWLSRPQMSDYIGRLNEKLSIYHVVDEYTAYAGVDEETCDWLVAQEQSAATAADTVIVVTPALLESKSAFNANTYLVPNAVDYDAYADADAQSPLDMADLESPIIGFTGLVSVRLDFGMIREAAQARPEWSFVFVGSINDAECEIELKQLGELSNVHFMGVRPVEAMPAYLRHFDVCTIPYADDDSAANASPLKLYEYAAAGKPIVTTDFAAAREFPGHLRRVTNAAGFVEACEEALTLSRSDAKLLENQRYAARNTWEDRVDDLSGIIRAHSQR
jgi:glycosyltransferase involved in cell wall biosynthesis